MALPDRKIYVQKPQELRKLSAKAVDSLGKLPAEEFVYQHKHDGCSMMILVGVNVVRIFSREGNEVKSMPHIAEAIRKLSQDRPNMVYFGEAYHNDMLFHDINGAFRRQSPQDFLQAWLFDAVTLQEFREGTSKRPYSERVKALRGVAYVGDDAKIIPVATYGNIAAASAAVEPWRKQGLYELDGFMQKMLSAGWDAGVDNEGRSIKLKDCISVDLRCVGVVEGKGKFAGKVGALEVEWRGNVVQVSGGKLKTKEREALFADPSGIVGSIVEVHALSITPDGQLREPRYQRIRDDKTEPSE
ncbi:ATP-dependent DNA ligase [Pseudomonas phage vB_PpuP-IPa-2]